MLTKINNKINKVSINVNSEGVAAFKLTKNAGKDCADRLIIASCF